MPMVSTALRSSVLALLLSSCVLPKTALMPCDGSTTAPAMPATTLKQTGRVFDLAIQGEGYFTLRDPEAKRTVFTRYGRFRLSPEGALVSRDSRYVVEPAITLPTDSIQTDITSDGYVKVKQPCTPSGNPAFDCARLQAVGQILLARFNGQQSLREISPGMYELSCAGIPSVGAPGTKGNGTLLVGSFDEPVAAPASDAVAAPVAEPHFQCLAAFPFQPLPRATLMQTGQKLDLAIQGEGYFTLKDPVTGKHLYTRYGQFSLSPEGKFVPHDARYQTLLGKAGGRYDSIESLAFPTDTTRVEVSATGIVAIERSSLTTGLQPFGQFFLSAFPNREGLRQVSPKLFEESCASGPPLIREPQADSSVGSLTSGALEEDVAAGEPGTVVSPKWHTTLH